MILIINMRQREKERKRNLRDTNKKISFAISFSYHIIELQWCVKRKTDFMIQESILLNNCVTINT